jgi:ketosteroid isomerase-like protein
MRNVTAFAAMLLLMAGMAFPQQQDSAMASPNARMSSNVDQQLKDMENKWNKASLSADSDSLAPLLAEDFVNLDSDGSRRNKSETLDRTKKTKMEMSELSDMQVMQHGDTAIVTGTWTGKGTSADGKPFNAKEHWTDTWVKKNGQWQCVASAAAPIKEQQ